jgi:hypothetical protein
MPETTYTYNIQNDFPSSKVNPGKLDSEIRSSDITIALNGITIHQETVDIIFREALSTYDKTILDGDTLHPAGGLIAAHDNSPSLPDDIPVAIHETLNVMSKPSDIGERLWCFSSNFCDKTSWFMGSTHVAEKSIGTGNGIAVQFSLGDTYIIDVTHGKVSQEDDLVPTAFGLEGSTFSPVIKLDAAVQDERGFDKDEGGDYEVDYVTGTVTFYSAPGTGVDVRASYFKANSSLNIVAPHAGHQLELEDIEVQFSKDLVLTTDTVAEIWAYNPYDLPNKMYIPGTRGTYRTIHDFINWSRGSFPVIPKFGGDGPRALKDDIMQLRVSYRSPIILKSSQGAEWRMYLKDDIPLGGTFGTVTLYGTCNEEE